MSKCTNCSVGIISHDFIRCEEDEHLKQVELRWKNLKRDQKWNRWVNSCYKKWCDTGEMKGEKRMNDPRHFWGNEGIERKLKSGGYNRKCHLFKSHLPDFSPALSQPLPSTLPFPAPHPLSCSWCPTSLFSPELSISRVFCWGTVRTSNSEGL